MSPKFPRAHKCHFRAFSDANHLQSRQLTARAKTAGSHQEKQG